MSMICICDGCGKQQPADTNGSNWFKPSDWFGRSAENEHGKRIPLDACCRECIDKIDAKRKEAGLSTKGIMPF